MIQLVFDSPLMYVIDYPGRDVVEFQDKRSGRIGLLSGEVAQRFRLDFGALVSGDADAEALEDFIDGYDALANQSALVH